MVVVVLGFTVRKSCAILKSRLVNLAVGVTTGEAELNVDGGAQPVHEHRLALRYSVKLRKPGVEWENLAQEL